MDRAHPPTEPGESPVRRDASSRAGGAPDSPRDAEDRLARLERLVRYQWVTLGVAVVLLLGLLTVVMVQQAKEAARANLQLELLQDVMADFGEISREQAAGAALTDADVHRQLRESLSELRRAYQPLGAMDLSDPNANLDAILRDPAENDGGDERRPHTPR